MCRTVCTAPVRRLQAHFQSLWCCCIDYTQVQNSEKVPRHVKCFVHRALMQMFRGSPGLGAPALLACDFQIMWVGFTPCQPVQGSSPVLERGQKQPHVTAGLVLLWFGWSWVVWDGGRTQAIGLSGWLCSVWDLTSRGKSATLTWRIMKNLCKGELFSWLLLNLCCLAT